MSVAWSQLQTLLWLRWRLTRNQWRRGGGANVVIALISTAGAIAVAMAGFAGGIAGGALALSHARPTNILHTWDVLAGVFLFFWITGIVAEIQRSETIDLRRLMHLPMTLREAFVLNYIISLFRFSIVVVAPAMLGLVLGLTFSHGPMMALLFPLVAGFFFMITAWTYCLRGWLVALMVNPRRRRAVVMGITLAFVLLSQVPNLVFNAWPGGHRPANGKTLSDPDAAKEYVESMTQRNAVMKQWLEVAHRATPPLWLPFGAGELAKGRVWPAVWGAAGMLALGAWGLRRAYRSTVRFYAGQVRSKSAAAPTAEAAKPGGLLLLERELPAIPEQAAALALANFRSLARAPEVKMALGTNVIVMLVMGLMASWQMQVIMRTDADLSATTTGIISQFVATGVVAFTFFGLAQLLFNHFGLDRAGFRALVLTPASRRHILLGKSLSFLPFTFGVFAVLELLVIILAHPPLAAIASACLQFVACFLTIAALGNWFSIVAPYQVSAGSLKPTKLTPLMIATIVVSQMLFPLYVAPIFVPVGLGAVCTHFGWLPGGLVNLVLSLLLVAASAAIYKFTLGPLGRLLERREQRILQIVTKEVE